MDSDSKYLSDSELNRTDAKSSDSEWKRRRNGSGESYFVPDSDLKSRTRTRKFDDEDESKTILKSPLSIDSVKSYFLANKSKHQPPTRNEILVDEIVCNQSPKVVSTIEADNLDKSSQIGSENATPAESGAESSEVKTSSSSFEKNINLHLDICQGDGETPVPMDIKNDSLRTSPKSSDDSTLSEHSKSGVELSSIAQSQNIAINESSNESPKSPLIETEKVYDIEEENSCEHSIPIQNSGDSLCQEESLEDELTSSPPSAKKSPAVTDEMKGQFLQSTEGDASVKDFGQIGDVFLEERDIRNTLGKSPEREKEQSSAKADSLMSSYENSTAGTSSPYQTLGDKSTLAETIIGQPRCLTLKQHSSYYNPLADYELDFDFEITDDIDEDLLSSSEQQSENKTKKLSDPNDMFLDDDSEVTEVQNIPYINLASPTLSGRNRECSNLEKEEGELTPELQSFSQTNHGELKETNLKKSNGKESNLEFFSKVNKCFFQLDKEFNNIRIPRDSKKLIEQLQDTLKIVKRMDRKLSLLIESVNSKGDKDRKHLKHVGSSASRNGRYLKSDEFNNASSSRKDSKRTSEKFDSHSSRSNDQHMRQGGNYHDSKLDNSGPARVPDGRHGKNFNTSESKDSQMTHDRKTGRKISPSEARREKQRIQSLFKRQMNLITRHVVQKNKTVKKKSLKPDTAGKGSEDKLTSASQSIKDPDISQKLSKLKEVKTLEDMEAFFEMLKERRVQASTTKDDGVIDYKEKHGALKFTTKKNKHTEWRSLLENVTPETKKKAATTLVPSTKSGDSHEKENNIENSKENEENSKVDKDIWKSRKELHAEEEQMMKYNLSNPFNASESEMADLLRSRNSKEQRYVKSAMNKGRDISVEEIRLQNGEELNDSFSVKKNSKEMECIEPISELRVSDFEANSREITPNNSKKIATKKRKHSRPKSSESDSQRELKDRVPKKRKRAHSRRKLSSTDRTTDTPSISKSQSRSRYHSEEEEIDYFGDRLPNELKPKNLFIVADKNLSLLDKHFCLKVRGNQIFLQTTGRSRSKKYKREFKSEEIPRERKRSRKTDKQPRFDPKNAGTTLKEMEDFLQQLRSKKVAREEQQELLPSSHQSKEAKFMARIQAKRKAKLMACISETPTITEKEAKFLKDLEKRAREPCDSPETLHKKQKLLQKIRAETDAIVLAQKQCHRKNSNTDEDPLSDVKTILSMFREAESGSDANSRQFLVSFPLKRSDVKQLESITAGKTPALSEESQKFLNSVRAKMRAKKTAVGVECPNHAQSQKD